MKFLPQHTPVSLEEFERACRVIAAKAMFDAEFKRKLAEDANLSGAALKTLQETLKALEATTKGNYERIEAGDERSWT